MRSFRYAGQFDLTFLRRHQSQEKKEQRQAQDGDKEKSKHPGDGQNSLKDKTGKSNAIC